MWFRSRFLIKIVIHTPGLRVDSIVVTTPQNSPVFSDAWKPIYNSGSTVRSPNCPHVCQWQISQQQLQHIKCLPNLGSEPHSFYWRVWLSQLALFQPWKWLCRRCFTGELCADKALSWESSCTRNTVWWQSKWHTVMCLLVFMISLFWASESDDFLPSLNNPHQESINVMFQSCLFQRLIFCGPWQLPKQSAVNTGGLGNQ